MPDSWNRHHAPPPIAGAADTHLAEHALTDTATAADLKHLADCLYCTRRAAATLAARGQAASEVADLDAFEQALTERLREKRPDVFTAAKLPASVVAVVQAPPARPDVAPAQLWRLSFAAMTMLVGVISTDGTTGVVAPVTPDVNLADGYTLVLPGTGGGLDGPWAIWLALARPVPLFVFDRYYAPLTLPEYGRGVAQVAQEVIASYRSGDATDGAPVGTTPTSELSVLALADSLREQLSIFADSVPEAQAAAAITFDQLKQALIALSPEQLGQAGMRRGDLFGVVRGTEELDEQQATALAPLLGLDAEQLRARPELPHELVREAHRVEWREARESWAARNQIEPVDAPMRLAKSAFGLAARTDAGAGGSRWRALVLLALHHEPTQSAPRS